MKTGAKAERFGYIRIMKGGFPRWKRTKNNIH